MATHLKRAPWDDRSLCGRAGNAPKTFDWEICTCKLCIRSDLAFAAKVVDDDCDLDRDSDGSGEAGETVKQGSTRRATARAGTASPKRSRQSNKPGREM